MINNKKKTLKELILNCHLSVITGTCILKIFQIIFLLKFKSISFSLLYIYAMNICDRCKYCPRLHTRHKISDHSGNDGSCRHGFKFSMRWRRHRGRRNSYMLHHFGKWRRCFRSRYFMWLKYSYQTRFRFWNSILLGN